MGQSQTGTYDFFVAFTEAGLERVIRAAFLEYWARDGVPVVHRQGALDGSQEFVAFFGLPSVALNPDRMAGVTHQVVENAIGIRLPYADSAIVNNANPGASRFNLQGALTIILPVIDQDEGGLAVDLSQLRVWLEPYDLAAAILEPILTQALREQPPEQLAGILTAAGLGQFQDIPPCPPAASGEVFGNTPTLAAPQEVLGLDGEMHTGLGAALRMLQLKAKMTPRALATGTADDPAQGNGAWIAANLAQGGVTPDMGLLLSNRLLLEEMLPPTLMRTLLAEQIEAARATLRQTVAAEEAFQDAGNRAINREVDRRFAADAYPALAGGFFTFPLNLVAPIPRTFPLPTIWDILANPGNPQPSQAPDSPNCLITAVSADIFPGGAAPSTANIGLTVAGANTGYSFTANITIELLFSHQQGELRIVPNVPQPQVTVNLAPWVYAGAAVVSTALLAPLGPISTFVGLLAVGVVDVLMDSLAASSVQQNVAGELGDVNDLRFDAWLNAMVLRRVQLDDLTLSGAFRIDHDWQGDRRSTAAVLERDSIAFEQTVQATVAAPDLALALQADGPTAIQVQSATNQVTPAAHIRLCDFGVLARHWADNFSQADLRATPETAYQSGARALAANLTQGRHVFGVCAVDGVYPRFGLLQAWRTPLGRLRGFLRFYRQTQPGLSLETRWISSVDACVLVGEVSENIAIPVLAGPGVVDVGSIAVGMQQFDCINEVFIDAAPHRLRPPVGEYHWTVVLTNGSTHAVPAGAATTIDVDSSPTAASPVTFELQDNGATCFVRTASGKSGQFSLRATVTELGSVTHTAETQIQFQGARNNIFGFDRWLEEFERIMTWIAWDVGLYRDPGTIDPAPVDLFGDRIYPAGREDLLRPGREDLGKGTADLVLLAERVSTKDLLARDPTGERGLQASDLVRVDAKSPWQGTRRRLDGRVTPRGLFGQEAKKELHSRVASGFAQMRAYRVDAAALARHEKRLLEAIARMPGPDDLARRLRGRR